MEQVRWENEFRSMVVCVDRYEDRILNGRLYNPYLEGGKSFRSTMGFLLLVEGMLDEMKFPQRFDAVRSFRSPAEGAEEAPAGTGIQTGRLATFALRVLFRQNASWQGSVRWLEGRREERFRSVLELLLLLNSVLSGNH